MDDDCAKLTAYFDERQRSGDRFFSDVLLDLYEQHNIATSIVLRGIGGFGPSQHLRSDRSLSLSEDPPVAVIAVDDREAVEALLGPLRAIDKRALITLERAARLSAGETAPVGLPDKSHEAAKLTIYIGRKQRIDGAAAYIAVCELLHRRGLAGATVLLGVDGTMHGHRHRARFFGGNTDVPMMIIVVGSGADIGHAVPEVAALLDRPLLTVERVRVCKRDGDVLHRPHGLPSADDQGRALWQKLTISTFESDLYHGTPIHRAAVELLHRRAAASGATVLRGVWGFYGDRKPHGDKMFRIVRRVPVVTTVIDTPQAIAAAFDVVDELTQQHGLVTSEMVPALVSVRGDERRGAMRMARYHY